MDFLSNLRCPITKEGLLLVQKEAFGNYPIPANFGDFGNLTAALTDASGSYFYPIFDDIIILHEQYALFIGTGQDQRGSLSFDKKRVFDYYNEVHFKVKDSLNIYEDSPKWVDFRAVSSEYMRTAFKRAAKFYPPTGTYLLDIASGPIGLPEYMTLCDGYDYRVCIDISINALIQAKINLEKAGKRGIFICGDITNIPLQDQSVDTVLSQHTLYHLPKNDQKTAVNEMYRVAGPKASIVIIYGWFYHSWFMNLSLNVVQLYRIIRHFAGKVYVRLAPTKPRLYFYPHSPGWFRRSFEFSDEITFHCWRSTNIYFMNIFIHERLGGQKILAKLTELEEKYSTFMSTFGEYPAIVIKKKSSH